MLVLSRKLGEEIVLPELGISIKLVEVHGHRVRLGISAPKSVAVLRSEVVDPPLPRNVQRQVARQESRYEAPKSALGHSTLAVAK